MRVLLVGAAGFVGRQVLRELVARDHSVVAVDRIAAPLQEAAGCRTHADWHVADMATADWELVGRGVDAVICTAASLAMGDRISDWSAVVQTNIVAFARLFHWASSSGVERFVFTSSAGMYRRPTDSLPVTETAPLCLHRPYYLSKAMGEQLAFASDAPSGMKCWALRLSSPYGPGQPPRSVLPAFIEAALSGRDVTYHGNGTRSQDFVHVDDASWAHVECLHAAPPRTPGPINIGSGEEMDMRRLAEGIVRVFGRTGQRAVAGPADGSDGDRFVLDISAARSLLGFKPRRLETGLADWKASCE